VELQKVAKKLQDRVAMLQLRDLDSSSSTVSRLSVHMGRRASARMSKSIMDVVFREIEEFEINDEVESDDGNDDNLSYGDDVKEIPQDEK